MRILVTGGTGVVGAAAIPELLHAGHTVRLLSRHADEDTPEFPDGVEPFRADAGQPEELAGAAEGCDVVLHIAGIVEEHPPEVTFERVNVAGTRHLLDAAAEAGSPRFVFLSSLGAERGGSAYHTSKRQAEELVRHYGGPWLILRSGNVYGPGDDTISMLLKMTRTLPAVPMVGGGDQPFQPIWFTDLGRALRRAVENRDLAGETLELAGADVTTTEDVLTRLEQITGRKTRRLAVPVWLAEVGAKAVEGLGGFGQRLLQRANLSMPINSSKLSMLLEENVLQDPSRNALMTRFDIEPTPLQDALDMLADLLPEQTPGDGVGAIEWANYFADIQGAPHSPEELMSLVCDRVTEVMPLEFAAEPGVPSCADEGSTLTASIPGRGHVQVRVEERRPTSVTLATLEGHPLAGVVRLEAESVAGGVRFSVQTASQPSNAMDWVAMRVLGAAMQTANWRAVVRRVVELAGGTAPAGVKKESGLMDENESHDLREWADRVVKRQQRIQKDKPVINRRVAGAPVESVDVPKGTA